MDIFEIVQAFAATHGCIFGICDASPLDTARLEQSAFVPFVSRDIKKRTCPSVVLPGALSVIVLGVGASQGIPAQNNADNADNMAQLSSLGTNDDYHIKVKHLLRELADELLQHISFEYKILVDSPTLDERAFALRAGLGFYGRNKLIISSEFGTRFNIGLLLMDIPQDTTTHSTSQAKCPPNCRLCINACPNGALQPGYPLDTAKCISYLTQKRELTSEEKAMLHNQLYGCDICQDVCPFNASCAKTYVSPQEWLAMDDATFAEAYSHTAMLWQGAELLRRNAQMVR